MLWSMIWWHGIVCMYNAKNTGSDIRKFFLQRDFHFGIKYIYYLSKFGATFANFYEFHFGIKYIFWERYFHDEIKYIHFGIKYSDTYMMDFIFWERQFHFGNYNFHFGIKYIYYLWIFASELNILWIHTWSTIKYLRYTHKHTAL